MPKKIFISYATADGQPYAERIDKHLQEAGYVVWRDNQIRGGEDFYHAINSNLRDADLVIVIMTPGAVPSLQVTGEWNDALNRYVPIIIMKCRPTKDIPPVLNILQHIDAVTDFSAALPKLVDHLKVLDANRRDYLKKTLEAFQIAQRDAEQPARFQDKIDKVTRAIAKLDGLLPIEDDTSVFQSYTSAPITTPIYGDLPYGLITAFVGRASVREQIKSALLDARHRLISVIGRPNMGKTALTTVVLNELLHGNWAPLDRKLEFDGIVYLSATSQNLDLDHVVIGLHELLKYSMSDAIIRAWQGSDLSVLEKVNALLKQIANRTVFIVLDDISSQFDHRGVLKNEDLLTFIETVLQQPNHLRVIVTSSFPLRLSAGLAQHDQRIPVNTLEGLPPLTEEEGANLLLLLDAKNDNNLHDLPDDALRGAVRATHGIPLALNILFLLIQDDPWHDIHESIERFNNDPAIFGNLAEEQFQRMPAGDRRILQIASIYGRPITLDAFRHMASEFSDALDINGIVNDLIKLRIMQSNPHNRTVWLPGIEQKYAYATVPDDATSTGRRALHTHAAAWYAKHHKPESEWHTLADLDSYLAEFDQLMYAQRYDESVGVLNVIEERMLRWGGVARLLEFRFDVIDRISDIRLAANNLGSIGVAYRWLGESDKSLNFLDRAVQAYRQSGLSEGLATWLVQKGALLHVLGQSNLAIPLHAEAIELARMHGEYESLAFALNEIALCYLTILELEKAAQCLQEALEISERFTKYKLSVLGDIGFMNLNYLARDNEAREYYEKVKAYARDVGNPYSEGLAITHLAKVQLRSGNLDSAMDLYRQSLSESLLVNAKRGLAVRYYWLGMICYLKGDIREALSYAEKAHTAAQEASIVSVQMDYHSLLSFIYLKQGEIEKARANFQKAYDIAMRMARSRDIQLTRTLLARAVLHEHAFQEALDIIVATERVSIMVNFMTYTIHGVILTVMQDRKEAIIILKQALDEINEILGRTATLFEPQYMRGLCYAALALVSPVEQESEYRNQAHIAYKNALMTCSAEGVRADARLLLMELAALNAPLIMPLLNMLA